LIDDKCDKYILIYTNTRYVFVQKIYLLAHVMEFITRIITTLVLSYIYELLLFFLNNNFSIFIILSNKIMDTFV